MDERKDSKYLKYHAKVVFKRIRSDAESQVLIQSISDFFAENFKFKR